MKKNHIYKILAISMSFLFIGVSVSSATSNDNLLEIRDYIKKFKNVIDEIKLRNFDNENFELFRNIKDILTRLNTANMFLIFAINFFILYRYFSHENNKEWTKYSFDMLIFCMICYFFIS